MKISDIKKEMKSYRDFYGGDLLDSSEIDSCKNKEQLAKIIDNHSVHIEMMETDAQMHLRHFKQRILPF